MTAVPNATLPDATSGGGYDVIVVMGAAPHRDGTPSPAMRRRVAHAVELFHRGAAASIVVTGGRTVGTVPEAELMRDLAVAGGVPDTRIVMEPTAMRTLENATRCVEVMRARGWSRPLVVTDRVHLPRSLFAFRAAGIRARGSGVVGPGPFRRRWHYPVYEATALVWYAALVLAGRHRR